MKIEIQKHNDKNGEPFSANLILAADNAEDVRFLEKLSSDLSDYLWIKDDGVDFVTKTLTIPIHGIHRDSPHADPHRGFDYYG